MYTTSAPTQSPYNSQVGDQSPYSAPTQAPVSQDINPEDDPQAKQKQLAKLLMAQSQPQGTQYVGGWAVPQSAASGLGGIASSLGQAYAGMNPAQQNAVGNAFNPFTSL